MESLHTIDYSSRRTRWEQTHINFARKRQSNNFPHRCYVCRGWVAEYVTRDDGGRPDICRACYEYLRDTHSLELVDLDENIWYLRYKETEVLSTKERFDEFERQLIARDTKKSPPGKPSKEEIIPVFNTLDYSLFRRLWQKNYDQISNPRRNKTHPFKCGICYGFVPEELAKDEVLPDMCDTCFEYLVNTKSLHFIRSQVDCEGLLSTKERFYEFEAKLIARPAKDTETVYWRTKNPPSDYLDSEIYIPEKPPLKKKIDYLPLTLEETDIFAKRLKVTVLPKTTYAEMLVRELKDTCLKL